MHDWLSGFNAIHAHLNMTRHKLTFVYFLIDQEWNVVSEYELEQSRPKGKKQ